MQVSLAELRATIRDIDPIADMQKQERHILQNPNKAAKVNDMITAGLLFQDNLGSLYYIKDSTAFPKGASGKCLHATKDGLRLQHDGQKIALSPKQAESLVKLTEKQTKRLLIVIQYLNESHKKLLYPNGDTTGMRTLLQKLTENQPLDFYYFPENIGAFAASKTGPSGGTADLATMTFFGRLLKNGDVRVYDEVSFLRSDINPAAAVSRKEGHIMLPYYNSLPYAARILEIIGDLGNLSFVHNPVVDSTKSLQIYSSLRESIDAGRTLEFSPDAPLEWLSYSRRHRAMHRSSPDISDTLLAVLTAGEMGKEKPSGLYVTVTRKADGKVTLVWPTTNPDHGVSVVLADGIISTGVVRERELETVLPLFTERGANLHVVRDENGNFLSYLIDGNNLAARFNGNRLEEALAANVHQAASSTIRATSAASGKGLFFDHATKMASALGISAEDTLAHLMRSDIPREYILKQARDVEEASHSIGLQMAVEELYRKKDENK